MKRFFSYLRDHYEGITKIFLLLVTAFLLVLIFPKEGKFKYEFRKGKPWPHENLIAPFDFTILKSNVELGNEIAEAEKNIQPVFNTLPDISGASREKLQNDFNKAWLANYSDNRKNERLKLINVNYALQIFDALHNTGIIDLHSGTETFLPETIILVKKDNVAREASVSDFYTIQTADKYIRDKVSELDKADKELLTTVLQGNIVRNVVYDVETTLKEKEAAREKVSLTRGVVQTGERIISKGELVTNEKFQLLSSLRQAYNDKLGSSLRYTGILIGQIILVLITVSTLFLFLYFFMRDVFHENKQIILILLLILGMVYLTRVIVRNQMSIVFIIPLCLIPIIIRVFFNTRLALFVHLITIIITGFLVPNSFEFVFLQLFAGIVTILSIVKLERRSQFFLSSITIFLTYSAIYTGMVLVQEGTLKEVILRNYVYFGISAVLTLFSYPVIFVFEKIFGLITDVTLLELSNTNNKLLRELALKAPGTFQHSMQVANLSEEAAYAIEANPLLVRTGAMYHDIGKMDFPLYFIE
ncbi:MAG: HDIG domain-containing protein, partial [Bacteroidales bacterium]|nr:HDIG domain-containing protein [Bacteroidales bacterium]